MASVEWPVLTEEAVRAALEKDEAEAPARYLAQRQRLTTAYGEEWVGRVQDLPSAFGSVAVPAALARLCGVDEVAWIHSPGNADSWLTHTFADPRQPHSDAPNRYEQAIAVLKDWGLWPWLLLPRLAEGEHDGAF